ncbi:MAG: beta-eliminating lyase-related protein [Actinomycetota bacterium]|nr:beta-eliminating lyase-related protein [Actinomycetota bacterium]
MADDELDALLEAARRRCTRFLGWPGPRRPQDVLRHLLETVPGGAEPDLYGRGGLVEELEGEVGALLGKPAAVFAPTGTLVQQIALRIQAERAGCRTVAYHPTSHLEAHEQRAYAVLHGLVARLVGVASAPLTRADLDEIAEPVAALLLELPQREIGGVVPDWDDLLSQTSWARERGVALHLDGARLWECLPAYDRPAADIAGLFDTVYVSFYKGLGALAGAVLAGPSDVIAQSRVWLRRHGGNVVTSWPYAASALHAVRTRLPRMATYAEHARALAAGLETVPGVEVLVPPRTPLFHTRVRVDRSAYRAGRLAVADEQRLWLPPGFSAESPRDQRFEVSVGEEQLDVSVDAAVAAVSRLVGRAPLGDRAAGRTVSGSS